MNKTLPLRRSALLATILLPFLLLAGQKAAAVEALLLQDTYVDNGSTGKPLPNNSNYGTGTDLRVFKGSGRIGRTFLKFSLATLPPGTAASDIAQARLRFWVNGESTLAGSITVSPVTTPWDELTLKDNATAGLSFGTPKLSELAVASLNNFVSIDVTDLVISEKVSFPSELPTMAGSLFRTMVDGRTACSRSSATVIPPFIGRLKILTARARWSGPFTRRATYTPGRIQNSPRA